jgi:hypothetical protein
MPETKTPTNKQSKSDFIRAQPATLSVAEVIAKGKAEGIKFGSSLVYMVRRPATKKPKKVAAPNTKPTASPTSNAKPRPSKSDFIRGISVSVSAKDVVAQGKAAGLKIHVNHVYKVRGSMGRKAKKGAAKTKAAKPIAASVTSAAPKSAAAKTPARTKSKADFVRARAHLSPKEIVEDAKAEGVKFDANYVYRVRAMDKVVRKKKRVTVKTTTSTPTPVNGAAPSVTSLAKPSSSVEDLLRAVAAELGLGRAVEILAAESARIQAIIAG